MPVSPSDVFGLLSVKVNEVFAPTKTVDAAKALVIVGGVATVNWLKPCCPFRRSSSHVSGGVGELPCRSAGYRDAELALLFAVMVAGQSDTCRSCGRQRSTANRGGSIRDSQSGG